jgi:hypothetical protein
MFLRLPPEIQFMIYNLVLIHVGMIETCHASLQNDILPLPSRVSISRRDLSLLAINHNIRSVTLPLFWGKNTFCFDASSDSNIKVRAIYTNPTPTIFRNPFHAQGHFVAVLLGVANNNNNDRVGPAFFGPKNSALVSTFGGLGSIYHSQCTKACGRRPGAPGWLH